MQRRSFRGYVISAVLVLVLAAAVEAQTRPAQAPPVQTPATQTPPVQNPPSPAHLEPPDPTNLQVFPKDIPKADLVRAMRGFTQALGVRCDFCHAEGANGSTRLDFASDDKRQKRNARLMMAMTADINARLANVPVARPAGERAVTCFTCHRGEKTPLTAKPAAAPGV